ncbi:MAG TPA: hypothetical protein VLN49_09245 [Gemmatimonadaceae bacterium]|nr:hypothetical protein [Gemmatimonadaceae bacterium]
MILYRPVGLEELRLVYESGLAAFPPRRPEQPIFYPVLNAGYAAQIARDWNARSDVAAGYVTRFEVDDRFVQRYDIHQVGAAQHIELWVPAEELAAFNRHIQPPIRVTGAYFGDGFKGLMPAHFMLAGRDAVEQFVALDRILSYSAMDFSCEIATNQVYIFLHYPFWQQRDFAPEGVSVQRRDHVLAAIAERWKDGLADRPLPELLAPAA